MAMTKKERAEFDKARSYRSLRFSDYPTSKDLSPLNGLVTGFDINVSRVISTNFSIHGYSPAVYAAWSEKNAHGTGDGSDKPRRRSSRDGILLYSTKKRALGALRRELEDKFAALLLEIDDAIAEEELKENQK
ncbi:hypothetical protein MPI44_004573 [Klebsiella oxytoca]|nr:hypothetical protein [Klebsiella oxytoca]